MYFYNIIAHYIPIILKYYRLFTKISIYYCFHHLKTNKKASEKIFQTACLFSQSNPASTQSSPPGKTMRETILSISFQITVGAAAVDEHDDDFRIFTQPIARERARL